MDRLPDGQPLIDELIAEMDADKEPKPSRPVSEPANFDDETILKKARMVNDGEKFRRLYDHGDWSDYASQSEADQALCFLLAYWTQKNEEQIDRLFRSSSLYRKKWEREDYRTRTIGAALDKVSETYQAQQFSSSESKTQDHLLFPEHTITGLAGDFANLYSSYLEVPKQFLFMAFLTALGTLLSGRLTLAIETEPQPRLYVLLLGESADDRKSTAIKKVTEFYNGPTVNEFGDIRIPELNTCWGLSSAEGLPKNLKESPDLLICYDEFRQFISKCGIRGSVLLPCINTLFESNKYESHTKEKSVKIENAHISLLAASTVDTYEQIWDQSFTTIGFNNRLFLVPGTARKRFSLPTKIPDLEKKTLKDRLGQILKHVGDRLELTINQPAKELYHEWYMNRESSIHGKRLEGYAERLMTLLAVNQLKHEIDKDTTKLAIDLCNWQLDVRRLHDPIDADNVVAKMEEKIRRVLKSRGPLKERDLKKAVHYERDGVWFFNQAIKNLSDGRDKEICFDNKVKLWRATE